MDPLRCLRDFWVNKRSKDVSFADSNSKIKFGEEYEFSSTTATRFKSSNGEPYQLGALLFFMQKRNMESAKYMQEAKAAGVARVARADQQNMIKFLTGARAEAEIANITSEAAAPARSKRARDDTLTAEPAGARFKLADHERQLRCRDNLFLVANKNFSKLDAIYKEAEKVFLEECKQLEAKAKPGGHASAAAAAPARPQNRLKRAPEGPSERQRQLGVDIYGARATPSVPAAPGKPSTSSAHRHGTSASASGSKRPGSAQAPAPQLRPIIIVPQGDTALVNILNAPKLLKEGRFETVGAARAALAGQQVQQPVSIARPSPADAKRTIKFEIIDQPPTLKSERWERVVAVVCLGKKWQFHDFPFSGVRDGKTVELFANVVGYYFHFRDEAVPEIVRSWNVKQLSLDRNARHSDAQVAQEFFKHLAARLDARKTEAANRSGCKPQKLLYK